MQSFSTQEKISRLISKIQTDWTRANSGNHGVSRIDKDILTDDIKNLYDLIYDLDITGTRRNLPYVEKSLEKTEVVDNDKPAIVETHKVVQKDIHGSEEFSTGTEPVEKPEEHSEAKPVDQVDEQPEAIIGKKAESTEIDVEEKESVVIQPPLELEIVANDPDGEETTIKAEEIKMDAQAPLVENNSKPAPKTTLDLFSTSKTLADIYQKDEDNSLAAKIKQNKITDIKTAIGINDKFLFINEIFKGEMSSYNQAIETLNDTSDFHEAVHYIDHLKLSYANEENKTSFNRLFEIAKRKFH
jgi:hypothetical protein